MTGAYSGIDHRYTSIGAKGIVLGLGGTPQEAETAPWRAEKMEARFSRCSLDSGALMVS